MSTSALRLLGIVVTLAASGAGGAAQTPPPAADVDAGRTVYVKTGCAACHGLEGQGAPTSGPRIAPNPLPLEAFVSYIRTPKNQMPPYTAKVITDDELRQVRVFLESRPKPAAATVLGP
jgi:ubiquinol-cytochrome c reductase cytochrome c subunit